MIFKNLRIRTGSDSILSNQDWTRSEKFHSPLISARQSKQKISPNVDHHWSKKFSFLCMQTKWVCPSGSQRFCKNDTDSSLESLIVTRVDSSHSVKNVTRVELSSNFFQHDSCRVRVTKNRDSSRVQSLTRVTLLLQIYRGRQLNNSDFYCETVPCNINLLIDQSCAKLFPILQNLLAA